MQEWLKDKKNLPIVSAIGAFVLIGAIVLILWEAGILPPKPAPTPIPAANGIPPGILPRAYPPAQQAAYGGPPGTAAQGTVPGQAAALAAGAKVPAPPLNVAKGPDPFKVPGYRPFRLSQTVLDALRVRNTLPPVFIQQYTPKDALVTKSKGGVQPIATQTAPEVSSTMRMSGVITSDTSIKALLESNGVSTQVQPGDTVDGGKVLSIQPDGLILRTSDSRLVRVPLSGTPTGGNSPYGGASPYGGGTSPYGGTDGNLPVGGPGGLPGIAPGG